MLKGSIVALITPFKDENLLRKVISKLINYHIKNGTNGVVPGGTTGESQPFHIMSTKKLLISL